ncbi:L-threonylcarbamoyladenylate synthase [Spirosoma koreense]
MEDSELIERIRSGEVALLPTDTVYGLAASPTHPEAIDKIFYIKSRPKNVNLPIMVASEADILELGLEVGENAGKLLHSPFMPGALTLVLGFTDAPRKAWLEGREEVAVRIPSDEWLLSILRQTGPLLVTSANTHGSKANMGNVKEILKEISALPDIVIDRGILSNTSSTIVNCRHNQLLLEREGPISFQQIQTWLNHD